MKANKASIQTMSRWLFALLIPLTIFLGLAGVYQVGSAYENERQRTEERFTQLIQRLDRELDKPENYMANLLLQSGAVKGLNIADDALGHHIRKQEIYEGFGSYLAQDRNLLLIALYCAETDEYLERDNSTGELATAQRIALRNEVRSQFPQDCRNGTNSPDWQVWPTEGLLMLYRTSALENVYGLYGISVRHLTEWLENAAAEQMQVLVRYQGALPEADDMLAQALEGLQPGQSRLVDERRALAICREFHGVEFIALAHNDRALQRGTMLTVLLAVLALTAAITVLAYYKVWSRRVLLPLRTLKRTMEDIRTGNLQSRVVDPGAGSELREINDTFNHMMEDIRRLKIESYEKELLNRQTQLEYYRLQIRPHFYLNCMKNMYALAAKGDTARLEQSILLTSAYLRHSLQQSNHSVSLREELLQCQNYVNLVGVSASCPPELVCVVEDNVQDLRIPAVSLLTFVENCLKHAPARQMRLRVEIHAKRLAMERQACLHLSVRDNGSGFPEAVLARLNKMDWDADTDGHVGLKNVIRRIQLMYSGETHVLFYNDHGAVVELFIPLPNEQSKETSDEAADC